MTTFNPDHRHDANLFQQLITWAFYHPEPQKRVARGTMTLLLVACVVASAAILLLAR